MKPARTRFAPSPTGFLHVGGVRTALFSYLLAKKTGGQFILRLEDTDRERFVAEGVQQIVDSLAWLGLEPDEGFWISEGQHRGKDHIQSKRQERGHYQEYADQLLEKGLAYRDWTTSEQLTSLRHEAQAAKRPFIFRKSMAQTDGDQGKPHAIRFDVSESEPEGGDLINWEDAVRGNIHLQHEYDDVEDFIIMKSDSFPTYNFANVVDDHDMNITHVLRGEEFIPSTPKHVLIYDALDFERPVFAHLPVINGIDGKKLSKRTGDTNVLDYRDKGYLPEALLNFLALLGWNDGTEQEIYSLDELIAKFDLAKVNKSPAIFDQRRLDWINGYWIREKLSLDELYDRAVSFWPSEAAEADKDYKKQVLGLVQERLKYFAELPELTRFFFVDLPIDKSLISTHKQLKKLPTEQLKKLLEQTKTELEASDFTVANLTDRLNKLLEQTGQKPAVLFSLIRIATTQAPASPSLADTLAVLGKQRSLDRLETQLAAL